MAHLWNIPDHVPDACQEVDITTEDNPLVTMMKSMMFTPENVPKLTVDKDLIEFIERNTRGQRTSEMWHKLHIGRLTSSVFGDVLHAGPNPTSLIKQILEGSSLKKYTNLPPAIQWGIDKEGLARMNYVDIQTAFGRQIRVEETGLTLCASHSFLGASSDGRVIDGDSLGVLEIKCPHSMQGTIADLMSMRGQNFCLEESDEGPRLKRSHRYYAQVQGEMAIMGLPWCDFVVWTNAPQNNIFIERIPFDEKFVKYMMPKLVEFYVNHIAKNFYTNL